MITPSKATQTTRPTRANIKQPLPDLAQERPTMPVPVPVVTAIKFNTARMVTVTELVNLLRDAVARMETADLDRCMALGELAYQEAKGRGGD